MLQGEQLEDVVDAPVPLVRPHLTGEPQHGPVPEGRVHGQRPMQQILLRHHPDHVPQDVVLPVQIVARIRD